MASGLKVNLIKSKLFGVGISSREVERMANWMGCKAGSLSFDYLGLPAGANMRQIRSWNVVIEKFSKKLAA